MYIIKIFRPFLFMCYARNHLGVMPVPVLLCVCVCACVCVSRAISRVACAHNSFSMFIRTDVIVYHKGDGRIFTWGGRGEARLIIGPTGANQRRVAAESISWGEGGGGRKINRTRSSRQTHKHTNTQTGKQTNRQTHKQEMCVSRMSK